MREARRRSFAAGLQFHHEPVVSTASLMGRRTIFGVAVTISEATITCPMCGFAKTETMPPHACQFFYTRSSCDTVLKPLPGDCCVFCSYSDRLCPPKPSGDDCG